MKGEANVNPTESVAYRKSLLEKGRKEMTMEEKELKRCFYQAADGGKGIRQMVAE